MDNLSEIIYVIGFVLFVVIGIVRYLAEGRDVAKRNQEGTDWTLEELPEETKRMLFGDKAFPTMKPAERSLDPFDEPRPAPRESRAPFEPRMAKPRQGAPVQRPPAQQPPPVPRQAQPQTRQVPPQAPAARPQQQPQFRPEQTQRVPTPPRQPVPAQQPRMVPNAAEGRMQREQQPARRQQQPQQQRKPQRAPQQYAGDEGPRLPYPVQQQKTARPARKHSRWLSNRDDLRRGIILMEILGPPKALQ